MVVVGSVDQFWLRLLRCKLDTHAQFHEREVIAIRSVDIVTDSMLRQWRGEGLEQDSWS